MGTLQRYILRSFLVAAGLTGLVLTFVLSVGFLFQVFQFIIKGASAALIGEYLAASLPEVLGFTIPLALMVSSLLVFGRLSTDSEVAAMKACGVSFTAIMRGPILVGIACTALVFYLQNYAMPNGHYVRRTISNRLAIDAGVQLIEPGRFISEIDNVTIFCDRKVDLKDNDGRNYTRLFNLLAIDRRDGFLREIQAEHADMRAELSDLIFTLHNATITPPDKAITGTATFTEFTYVCKDVVSRQRQYLKKPKDFTLPELYKEEQNMAAYAKQAKANEKAGLPPPEEGMSYKAAAKYRSKLRFLLHYRAVWALSAFCFVLVGVPLGCQSQRKESSRGMMMGVVIGIAFFLFIMLAQALEDKPAANAWLLVWTPVLICLGSACYLIPKNQ